MEKVNADIHNKKSELLLPAGNLDKLKTAFHFGADAVYAGGKVFSLRSYADNFTDAELEEGIEYAHSLGKKVYVAANVFAKNSDFKEAEKYFKFLERAGADAALITDVGFIELVKQAAPALKLHLSTQANTTNKYAARFWARVGVERIVLAREISLKEIKEIREFVPEVELEAFVHGAMCMSYSGRCLLSSYFSGRSANRGECLQPCRWSYRVTDTLKNEKPLDIEQDERGTYFMNSKDLKLVARLPELIDAGVSSFKIEGRMKSEFYIASTAAAYRRALDEYLKTGSICHLSECEEQLERISHRPYTEAFFDGENNDTFSYEENKIPESDIFIATADGTADGKTVLIQRNRFKTGDTLTVLSPDPHINGKQFTAGEIFTEDGATTDDAKLVKHPYRLVLPFSIEKGDIILKTISQL